MKNIYFIILSVLVILYILYSIRKNKISIKTSFSWMILCIIMLFLSIFPKSIDFVAEQLGVYYAPTLLLTGCVVLLLIKNFNSSKEIYYLQEKVNYLAEEVSLLKSKKTGKK
ncbi:MAG: DUF2304 domain-containing protein [Bacilli bacterium]|nr:DUF2304 domain-containing protein [Bacilli bacterium]